MGQRQTLGHYGALVQVLKKKSIIMKVVENVSLFKYARNIVKLRQNHRYFQVVYEDWSLKLIEWCPPSGMDNPHLPLRPRPFVKIYVNDHQERCIELLDKDLLFRDVPEEALKDVIITSSNPNAMNVFLPKVKTFNPNSNVDLFDEMLMDYVHFETGERNFNEFAIHLMKKFNSKLNCRNVHGYLRLDPEKYLSKCPKFPIPSGSFKGTYGAHGIEVISISYPSRNVLEGFKLTGDPNVPMGKVTFKADLTKAIRLTRDVQKDFSCEALIPDEGTATYESIDFEAADHQPQPQPFCLPSDVFDRASEEVGSYQHCQYRFLAEGQIAHEDYQNPQFVPAHLIIFDQDHFGVLFLTLHSMSLYVRISEDLSATCFESNKV